MPRAYDFRQKKAINYNEKLSNRTKSIPSSARKTRGRKSEAPSIVSNSSRLCRRKTINFTYEEDKDDSPESSQATARRPFILGSSGNSTPDHNLTAHFPVLEDLSPPILTRECNNNSEVYGELSNRAKSNTSSARKTRGRKSQASSIVSHSSRLRRKKAVNHSYQKDEDDSPESSQAPIFGQPDPFMLDSTGSSNLIAHFPVLDDLSPPILTRECNNDSEVDGELSNRAKSNPSSSRKTRGRKSEVSPTVSNSNRLRRRKAVNHSYQEDEDDSPDNSQTPARSQFVLDSSGNSSPDPYLATHSPVLDDLSPPILTREVNNNMEEKDEDNRDYSPPPEIEPMEQMVSEDSSISNNSGVKTVFEVRPVLTLDELLEQRAKSAEKVLTETTPSPNPSEKSSGNPPNPRECEICGNPASRVHYDLHTCESCSVEFFSSFFDDPRNYGNADDLAEATLAPNVLENPPSSSQCKVCGDQANGVHFGVETCESCSLFFQARVTELPDYNCYCNRVWKYTFDIKISCHCCRFQKCLDVGMQIPPDSMFSRITPHSESLGLCRVCGDIGTSHCKGVVTCSACTFFVFRSTQKPFDGECDKICLISPSTRDCPACRFQKFREAESQIPKNGLEEPEQLGAGPSVVQQLSEVFEETCPYTEAKMKKVVPREFGWKPNESCSIHTNRRNAWIYFSRLLSKELEPIINFIQTIRSSLTPYDLRALIPRHAFSLLLLWWASVLTTRGLILSNGECIDIKTMGLLYGEELIDKMVRFAEDYKKNSHKEIAVFMRTVFLQTIDGATKRIANEYLSLRQSLLYESQVYDIEALIPRVNEIDKTYQEEVAVFLKENEKVFPTGNLFHSVFIKAWPDFVDPEEGVVMLD